MTQPLVSVIVPAYNAAKRVAGTLRSIIEQDYENLEIIVVNDASTDDTLNVAEQTLKTSGRAYKVITHEKNSGESASRNTGIDASAGEFICFCDGDDLFERNSVSILWELIQRYNCEISFGSTLDRFEDGRPDEPHPLTSDLTQPITGEQAAFMKIFKRGFMTHVCAMMYRKNFLNEKSLRFTPGVTRGADIEFAIKSLCRAERVCFTSEPVYVYVYHADMGTVKDNDTPEKLKRNYFSVLNVNIRLADYLTEHMSDTKLKFFVENSFVPEVALKRLTACAKFHDHEQFTAILNEPGLKKILLRSFKTLFFKPEIFLKSLAILIAPGAYYKLRQ